MTQEISNTTPAKEQKTRQNVGFYYPANKQRRLKHFCAILGMTISQFIPEALDNEIMARFEAMTPEQKKATQEFIGDGF